MALWAACLIPHLIRAGGKELAADDGFYAHAALMLSRGFEPYHHFTQVAFPLAEGFLALILNLFGRSVAVVETTNTVMVLGVATALAVAGRRLVSLRVGVLAALLWSWALWVVHFNVFERETWAALGTALALVAYFRPGDWTTRRVTAVAAGLALAFLVKITALMPAIGLCLHLALTGRRSVAMRLGVTYLGLVSLATLACWLAWGQPFLEQVFVFGFFRGRILEPGAALGMVLSYADHTTLLGLTGALLWALPRWRSGAGALLFILAMDLVYGAGLSTTFWNHNMINLAVTASLLGAGLIDQLWRWRKDEASGLAPERHVLASAVILGGLAWGAGVGSESWMPGEYGEKGPGFGGRSREGLMRRAMFLQSQTGPDDLVVCDRPLVAFEADRVKWVRYYDLQPISMGLEQSLAGEGLLATFSKREEALLLGASAPALPPALSRKVDAWGEAFYWKRLFANTFTYVRPLLLEGIEKREIALLLEPLPMGILSESDLRAANYEKVEQWGLTGWRPRQGAVPGAVHRIYGERISP